MCKDLASAPIAYCARRILTAYVQVPLRHEALAEHHPRESAFTESGRNFEPV